MKRNPYKHIDNQKGVVMYTALQIAAYIADEYDKSHTEPIDEMRLHKYLYLAQRESFIIYNRPLFENTLRAWKFGPVCVEVRNAFHEGTLINNLLERYDLDFTNLIGVVLDRYNEFSSWALSRLTHNEKSWRNARRGIPDGCNGNCAISLSDIRDDATEELRNRTAEAIEDLLRSKCDKEC